MALRFPDRAALDPPPPPGARTRDADRPHSRPATPPPPPPMAWRRCLRHCHCLGTEFDRSPRPSVVCAVRAPGAVPSASGVLKFFLSPLSTGSARPTP